MANFEDEVRDLREKNSELALEVQFWKMTASQKEKEKLDLMKEVNELRLKLSILRSGGAAQALKLGEVLQTSSEEALSHLVQASGSLARIIECSKQYMQERQEMDYGSPRWTKAGGTPNTDKVNRVPPLLLGGKTIQPVVSLSRTMLDNRSMTRNSNPNSGVTHRPLPMHMLQDVYIPLTRIDAADLQLNASAEEDGDINNSVEDLGLEDSGEQAMDESLNLSVGDMDESQRLDAVAEELENSQEEVRTPHRLPSDNPLEGPSWLLDASNARSCARDQVAPEADSTTPYVQPSVTPPATPHEEEKENAPMFTPTVRRRKRPPSPSPSFSVSPRAPRKDSNSGRVLKVVVAKMRLSDEEPGGSGAPPPKRRLSPPSPPRSPLAPLSPRQPPAGGESPRANVILDAAPSPNGATDARVIVSEGARAARSRSASSSGSGAGDGPAPRRSRRRACCKEEAPHSEGAEAGRGGRDSPSSACSDGRGEGEAAGKGGRDSVSSARSEGRGAGEGGERSRRPRRDVSYREKPLNRKMRR